MFSFLHAMLAAILGTGVSAPPAPNLPPGARRTTLPVVTYGASALGQPAGGVKEATSRDAKVKTQVKVEKAAKTWEWKETTRNGKIVKVKYFPKRTDIKVGTEHKENLNR